MDNSASFFKNTECSYFPCHKNINQDDFNCLFCYCPLYSKNPCPGNPTYIKKEDGRLIKRCTDCVFPHKPENYQKIMNLLRARKDVPPAGEYNHGKELFSVNINPLGLPENVKEYIKNAISSLDLCEKYPDYNCTNLKKKLSDWLSVKVLPDNIVFGNGASELISLAVNAISPKDALLLAPTFSGYERALKICDCRVHHYYLKEENDFAVCGDILEAVSKISPDMIFLCNPNNPTGRMIDKNLFERMLDLCEEKGIFLFVDECFIDFTERADETALRFLEKSPHLIVLNAFTKIFAMAGLRLGYLVSSNSGLLQKINSLRPEWNVSAVAQFAGEKMLDECDYVAKTRELVKKERDFLVKKLKALGFRAFSGEANFILFKSELKKEIPFLRSCANFKGLDGNFYRTSVRTHAENEGLVEKLEKLFS